MILSRKNLRMLICDVMLNESKYFGMSVEEVLSFFDRFSQNTWIFFDTETMGFKPHEQQLLEIAAVAANPNGWSGNPDIIGTFNEKISLQQDTIDRIQRHKAMSPEERKKRGRMLTAPDLLSMTKYGEKDRKYLDEQDVIKGFFEFVRSFPSPVLIAQNASFDMKFLSVRSEIGMVKYPVIDTMKIMQLFLIPLLRTLRDKHGDVEAGEFLQLIRKGRMYSASQGVVSAAYGISTDNWHSAIGDVEMLMDLFQHVVDTLREGEGVDISGEHGKTAAYAMKRKRRR